MNRRELLGTAGLALLGGGTIAGTALGVGPLSSDEDRPEYLKRGSILYERDSLTLRARQNAVRRGDTISFEITHTGESEYIPLGCHIVWAIQTYEDGEWKHAVWTGARYHNLCGTGITPGRTLTETVPISRAALADFDGIVESNTEFTPGKYRFILAGAQPRLTTNFRVLPSE